MRRCHKFDDFYAIASTFQECSLRLVTEERQVVRIDSRIGEPHGFPSIALAAKRH